MRLSTQPEEEGGDEWGSASVRAFVKYTSMWGVCACGNVFRWYSQIHESRVSRQRKDLIYADVGRPAPLARAGGGHLGADDSSFRLLRIYAVDLWA